MAKYYLLSVYSFQDTFRIIDAGQNVIFRLQNQNGTKEFTQLMPGDNVIVYVKDTVGGNIILQVTSNKNDAVSFIKKLEVDYFAQINIEGVDLDKEDLVEISKTQFEEVYKQMFIGLSFDVDWLMLDTSDIPRKIGAENVLLYGVPGAGKSYTINKEYCDNPRYIERVVFHPDYSYSDFVGQILPHVYGESELKYEFTPGPFTKILKKAWDDPANYYYLIIEEINRGNAPAIFGEIFQLLDRKELDKYPNNVVGESEYGIVNYDVAKEVFGMEEHQVIIPSNLYILATMNTADQNVFTLDTAFQRRWKMKHIKNDVFAANHADETIEGSEISWGSFASVVNEKIVDVNSDLASSEDKRLGAYFAKEQDLRVDVFPEKVIKYLWDDAFKYDKEQLFSKDFKSLDKVIEAYRNSTDDKLKTILRLDMYARMFSQMKNRLAVDENQEEG